MSYLQDCLQRFAALPDDLQEKFGGLEAFEKIENIEEEFGVDLKFLVILLVIGEISLEEAPIYLEQKYGLAEEDAYEIKERLVSDIFSSFTSKEETKEAYLSDNPKFSKDEVTEIFKKKLIYYLKDNEASEKEKEDFNQSIFFHLAQDGLWQDLLVKNLVENNEKITNQLLTSDNRELSPTISNWIKDFFKFYGADSFNDLDLINYLNTSPNARGLSKEEKNSLRKLLKTYYNLNFFPNSVENLSIDDWQIMPSGQIKKILQAGSNEGNEIKTEANITEKVNIKEPERLGKSLSSVLISPKNDKQEIEVQGIMELKKALGNYPVSSLEYKALTQEIARLEKK